MINATLPPLNTTTQSPISNIQSTMNTPLLRRRDNPLARGRDNMIRRDTQSIFNIVTDTLFNTDIDNVDNFFDPVPIVPTLNQIQSATFNTTFNNITDPQNTLCSFSLEPFQPETSVTQIIYCGHIFNPTSLSRWFEQSSRCPLCRFDIRNYNSSRGTLTSRTIYPRRETTFSPPLYSTSQYISQESENLVRDNEEPQLNSLDNEESEDIPLNIPLPPSIPSMNPFDDDYDNEN